MTQPPPPASAGDERETQAAASAAAAAAVLAAATAAILAALAASVTGVVTGSLGVRMARRKFLRAVAVSLGAASGKLGPVWEKAAKRADPEGIARLPVPGLPGTGIAGGKRHLPDAPEQVARAILTAQQDAGDAFDAAMAAALGPKGSPLPPTNPYRDVVDKAMRRLTGIGQDVKDLTGKERVAQSLSRLQAAQKVMDDLGARGLTGFTDSAGRRWSLDAYAEMATRTAASRLHLSAQLSSMAQAGFDLVIVDNPSMTAPCPLCRPYEGKVLSLSGDTTGLSTITDANGIQRSENVMTSLADAVAHGLLHPNCRHSLTPWADGHGAVATAGGAPRGYVERGQTVYRSLPIGTPQQYDNEQRLRAHERTVRRDHMRVKAAVTPQARAKARARLAASQGALEAHVRTTHVTRLPHREKAGRAR